VIKALEDLQRLKAPEDFDDEITMVEISRGFY
jgi:hypothetical protein